MVAMDESSMAAIARDVLGIQQSKQYVPKREHKHFQSFFGASIIVITNIWNQIEGFLGDADGTALPNHLFWAYVFLYVYSTEEVNCCIVGICDPGTFCKWSWYMLKKVGALKDDIIKLDNLFEKWDRTAICLMSINGINCEVMELWPFDKKWYSKKFNSPGVKYEVGICIRTGMIVWVTGPFVASKNDATIFREKLADLFADDEGVKVDAGYKGHDKFKQPVTASSRQHRKEKSIV
jgi:hypothetical protein